LLSVLRAGGLAPPPRFRAPTFIDEIIGEFEAHLRGACGAAQPTCRQYTRYVREFLEHRGVAARSALVRIDAPMLISFVSLRATRCKPGTAKLVATSLKSFLRFLGLKGVCDAGLVEAVPVVPRWKLASLPRVLTEEQLATLLQSFDRATAIGRRDYAMAQCLVQLGLRAAEVADLRLDDADWRRGTLRIAVGKSHRASVVPLPRQAGRAVVEYLRRGRPTTEDRHIFVQHVVPVGVQLNGAAVRSAIRRAFTRAGIAVPSKGTHALRHTAATRMLRAGASLKDLADVLRHRSLDTTLIYTKVDLPRLAAVALPWPEVHR
jgi:site-specific recombinase XerD